MLVDKNNCRTFVVEKAGIALASAIKMLEKNAQK